VPTFTRIVSHPLFGKWAKHVLCLSVRFVPLDFKPLKGKTEIELDINAESIRLIANAVIFHNATLLSILYEHYRDVDPEKAKIISRLSPVVRQHISFIGKYEFCNRENPINTQEVIKILLAETKINILAVSQ